MQPEEQRVPQQYERGVSNAPLSARTSKLSNTVMRELSSAIPPHNQEIEQLVLGALLLEKNAFPEVEEILQPECFYTPSNRIIYEAVLSLAHSGDPIDIQTVIERLRLQGKLKNAGGQAYIATLVSVVNSTAHLDIHARILYDKMVQRQLISFGNEIIQNAHDEEKTVVDTMQAAEERLFEITQGANKDDVQSVRELLSGSLEDIQKAAEQKEGLSGVSTGFPDVDQITSGWQKSDLVIIAARPAMGKTAFVLSMARTMAVDYGTPIAIFSLEMSKSQLMTRLIVNHTEIPNDNIKRGRLNKEQMQQLTSGLGRLETAPIFIDDNAGLTIFDLRSKARRLVSTHQIKVILIDYLQLMTAGGGLNKNANREQEVSTISRSLKQLARELGITIIALSQLNRSVEQREGKQPQLSDLRESGAIEQDADMVCFIHRPEYYGITENTDGRSLKGLAEFIIAKHRNGPTGTIYLQFQSDVIKFKPDYQGASTPSIGGNPTAGANNTYTNKTSKINTSHSSGATSNSNPTYDPLDDLPDDGTFLP